MHRSTSSLACVLVTAATIFTFSGAAFSQETKNPAQPATGQQIPKYCNGLLDDIQRVTDAINLSVTKVKADVSFSANKPAPNYSKESQRFLDGPNGALATIDKLKKAVPNPKTYAEAFVVNGHMDPVTGLLQQSRYQSMASASNNQSAAGRDAFVAITAAIAKSEALAARSGRCYMSPYAGG